MDGTNLKTTLVDSREDKNAAKILKVEEISGGMVIEQKCIAHQEGY